MCVCVCVVKGKTKREKEKRASAATEKSFNVNKFRIRIESTTSGESLRYVPPKCLIIHLLMHVYMCVHTYIHMYESTSIHRRHIHHNPSTACICMCLSFLVRFALCDLYLKYHTHFHCSSCMDRKQ